MIEQRVETGRPYSVYIGEDLFADYGAFIKKSLPDVAGRTVVIVSDSHVMPLYGGKILQAFEAIGCNVSAYEVPARESSKNITLLGEILEHLASLHVTRTDYLVALGGGMTGDLTGFAASIYLRGIKFIQIPTTLLAAVDSSVGGKTAVNLSAGKNQVGTFWQPTAVFCDTSMFQSLPRHAFLDGVAESIKYGILRDEALFTDIMNGAMDTDITDIVARCIAHKSEIVAKDEFDNGLRELLNLGHTFAHAIEANSDLKTSHGHAVAIGMHLAGKAAHKLGLCTKECSEQITRALDKLSFPLDCPYSSEAMISVMLQDKKRRGNKIDLILPYAIGDCRIYPTTVDELKNIL